MLQESLTPSSGLVVLNSVQEMRAYIRQLLTYYEKAFDFYSQKVGSLMRVYERQEGGKLVTKFKADDWRMAGKLMVNTRDTLRGTLEIMLETMEEYKAKLSRTQEVLVGLDELKELSIPEEVPLTLYLRNGVPMRVVVEAEPRPQTIIAQKKAI